MTDGKKVLILGGSSYVGRHLFAKLGPDRAIATYCGTPCEHGVYFDAMSMSLSDLGIPAETISRAVILLGDTKPESCAADIEKSHALNVDAIKTIINRLNQWHIKPVFTSSQYVFDGTKGNYIESDAVNPILTYGRQKVEIENYLQSLSEEFTIVRLGQIFGAMWGRGNIFSEWLEALRNRETFYCADDQIFSPICAEDVAEGIVRLIDQDCNGVFHLCGCKPISRLDFLRAFLDEAKRYTSVEPEVVPCSIHDFNLQEKRPKDLSMVPDKLVEGVGLEINTIEQATEEILGGIFTKR